MREFKLKITADVNDLMAQFKAGSKELKSFADGVAQAENKLEALSKTGEYLAQMDAQLSKLSKKYPNVFNEIFGTVDKDMKNALASIGKAPDLLSKSLTRVGGQLEGVLSGKLESEAIQITKLGREVQAVAKSLGAEVDLKFLDGSAKEENKAKKLIQVLAQLEKQYTSLGNITQNISPERIKTPKATKAPKAPKVPIENIEMASPNTADSLKAQNAEIQAQIDELEAQKKKYQEIIAVFNGDDIKLETTKKTDTEQLKDLVTQLNEATSAVNKYETAKNTSGGGYQKALAEQYRLASLVKNTMDEVADSGSNKALKYINTEDGLSAYSNAEALIDQFESMSSQSAARIKEIYANLISGINSELATLSQTPAPVDNTINDIDTGKEKELTKNLTDIEQSAESASTSINNLGNEIDETFAKETGDLESKLERLRDIADEYGTNITQRDRNSLIRLEEKDNEKELTGNNADRFYELQEKVESADEALMAFGEQYDKIILKLENGKKVEILPDDKGLRDLYKFMDEGYGETFNGFEVSDIEFVRKSIEETSSAGQKLAQESSELKENLNSMPSNLIDMSELDAAQQKIKALEEEALKMQGAMDSLRSYNDDLQKQLDGSYTAGEVEDMAQQYINDNLKLQSELENAREELRRIEDGGSYDDGYNDASKRLDEDLTDAIREANELRRQVESLQAQLRDSQSGTNNAQNIENTSSELTNLENLKIAIESVIAAIEQKTAAFVAEGTTVGSVVGEEIAAIQKLQEALKNVSATINSMGKIDLGASLSEIDKVLAKLADPSTNIEYLGMFNSKTGKVSDQLFGGDNGRSEGTFKNKSDYDTMFHNHPGVSTAAPSATDWGTFAKEFDNFKRQIIVTKDEIATFDLSGLTKKEMNEVAEEIQAALRTTVKNKSFVKNVEAYGLEEANQMWQRDLAAPILAKYSGIKMSVESTDRLFPKLPEQTVKDVRIEGVEKLEASIISLQKAIENAIGVIKQSEKDSSKKKDDTQKENKQKKPVDTFGTDKNKIQESFNSFSNSLNRDFIPKESLDKLSEMETRLKNITDGDELEKWKQDWNEVTKSISQATKESEDIALAKQKLQLNGLKNSVKDNYKSAKISPDNMTADQEALSQSYDDLIAKLETYSKQRRILSQEEMADLKKTAAAIKAQANVYAQAAKVQGKSAKTYKVVDTNKEEEKQAKLLGSIKYMGLSNSSEVSARIDKVNQAYQSLIDKQREYAAIGTEPTKEQKAEMYALAQAYNDATTKLEELVKESAKLDKNRIWSTPVDGDISTAESRKAILEGAINSNHQGSKISFDKLSEDAMQLNYSVKNADGSTSKFIATLNQAGTAVTAVRSKVKDTNGIFKQFLTDSWTKFQGAITRFTGFDVFYRGIAQIRQGIQYITEIDTALTELKKVTNETDEVYAQFLQTASKTGAEIGSTVADFTNATADFARLGHSIEEASSLAEAASIYKNVGD